MLVVRKSRKEGEAEKNRYEGRERLSTRDEAREWWIG